MPSLVVIGQQIKEKGIGAQCAPPQPIWFQNTPACIGLSSFLTGPKSRLEAAKFVQKVYTSEAENAEEIIEPRVLKCEWLSAS